MEEHEDIVSLIVYNCGKIPVNCGHISPSGEIVLKNGNCNSPIKDSTSRETIEQIIIFKFGESRILVSRTLDLVTDNDSWNESTNFLQTIILHDMTDVHW